MGIIIGLDIGGSTTKIVGIDHDKVISQTTAKASDPIASAFGALGKLLNLNDWQVADVECLRLTGVGASFPKGDLLGIKTCRVQEFLATGLGGLYLTGLDRAVVVSMGTGTAFVDASSERVRHIIGSGVGGGTLLGLANKILNVRDFNLIIELAQQGSLKNIDLSIGDISNIKIPGLSMDTTASNFGKLVDGAKNSDLALGIFNLVFQSVGTMAVLAARKAELKDVVITGQMTRSPQCIQLFEVFSGLYGIKFHVPELAEFATAIGAAIQLESDFDENAFVIPKEG